MKGQEFRNRHEETVSHIESQVWLTLRKQWAEQWQNADSPFPWEKVKED